MLSRPRGDKGQPPGNLRPGIVAFTDSAAFKGNSGRNRLGGLIAKMSCNIRHPKPAEGQIAGSQPSDKPLASTPAEGLAVAPVAEKSAPAADEMAPAASGHQTMLKFVSGKARAARVLQGRQVHPLPGHGEIGGVAFPKHLDEGRVGLDFP